MCQGCKLECRKWACNKWGFKGCLAALRGNRPKSDFFALLLPFALFSGGPEQHLENPENGGERPFPQISSNLLKPPSLKLRFAALQAKSRTNSPFRVVLSDLPRRPPNPERGISENSPIVVGVLRGNTIRGNTTRNSERRMAL